MQRAALSATLADPESFRAWLAPWGEIDQVALVQGEAGAPAEVEILLPQEQRVPSRLDLYPRRLCIRHLTH